VAPRVGPSWTGGWILELCKRILRETQRPTHPDSRADMSTGLIEEMAALAHHDAHVTHSYPEWKHAHLSYAREVVPLLDNFTHAMTAAGYSHKDVYGMRLALEEAIVNALRHGNKSDPSKRVFVRYCVRPDQALAEVEDQ